jgi:hypothetical protein
MGLARAWSSSVAALDAALRNRELRGEAICAALDAGALPTRDALRAWVIGDDAMQYALTFPVAETSGDVVAARDTLRRHLDAVRTLRFAVLSSVVPDAAERARILRRVARAHAPAPVVAFTCFEATARAIFRAMRGDRGVVLLTGAGARSSAGRLPRDDVLAALAPGGGGRTPQRTMPVHLVIATDVLAEGVNLQRAAALVHLDLPWTPAAIVQRNGRALRVGATNGVVSIYEVRPPPGAAALVAMGRRHRAKTRAATAAVRESRCRAAVANVAQRWGLGNELATPRHALARTAGDTAGFVAVVAHGGRTACLAGRRRGATRSGWAVTDSCRTVLALLAGVRVADPTNHDGGLARDARGAQDAIIRWLAARAARESAGLGRAPRGLERSLEARVDGCLATASAVDRPRLAAYADALREALSAMDARRRERAMRDVLADQAPDWLVRGAPVGRPERKPRPGAAEIVALLIIDPPDDDRAERLRG